MSDPSRRPATLSVQTLQQGLSPDLVTRALRTLLGPICLRKGYGSGSGGVDDRVSGTCRSLLAPEVSWINAAARCAASALLVGPTLALAPARPDGPRLGFLGRPGPVGSAESALMLLRRLRLKLRPRALSPSRFVVGYPYRYCELLKLAAPLL